MTEPDPRLVEARDALWKWYAFDHIEHIDLDAISDENFEELEHRYTALISFLCSLVGHKVIDDQCGKPEHRYCYMCLASTPNKDAVE